MCLPHQYFPIGKWEAMVSQCEVACQLNRTFSSFLSSSSPSSGCSLPTLRPPSSTSFSPLFLFPPSSI